MNEWEWQLLEAKTPVESISAGGVDVRKGDSVILRPRKGGDVFDMALAGKAAIIEGIEQDYEGKLHLAVIIEDDPGKDLGLLRQPGHRFYFTPEEVEPLGAAKDTAGIGQPEILVAGIGNIFLGDDAFGVEVVQRLSALKLPENVRVRDFGIRGYDLAYALLEGYETTILVDACPHGDSPGTLYVIDIENGETDQPESVPVALDPHTLNPVSVLRMARSMGPVSKRILLVGCEPATLGGEQGHMGLSEPVSSAIDEAVKQIEKLITRSKTNRQIREAS